MLPDRLSVRITENMHVEKRSLFSNGGNITKSIRFCLRMGWSNPACLISLVVCAFTPLRNKYAISHGEVQVNFCFDPSSPLLSLLARNDCQMSTGKPWGMKIGLTDDAGSRCACQTYVLAKLLLAICAGVCWSSGSGVS